jgi:hypothetical protein
MEEPQSGLFQALKSTLTLSSVLGLVGIFIAYRISIAVYNISPFHPLARFPGPKIAAASYLYEAYYDWWHTGEYGKVIARMHETYGPIIRYSQPPKLEQTPKLTPPPESTLTNSTAPIPPSQTKSTQDPAAPATNGFINSTQAAQAQSLSPASPP